jgi:hypothetical protein
LKTLIYESLRANVRKEEDEEKEKE